MTQALPVTIIGGYLGSGKTTLVNHLLRHANGTRLAVLVNDFGELPIDADLIESQDGNVISLSGGCICCSYGDDLSLSLQQLRKAVQLPEHVLIEASGVALPGAIGNTLSLHRAYQLDSIVVLADASALMQQVNEKYIGDTVQRQLKDADLLVLNKLDLLSIDQANAVRRWLADTFTPVPVIDAVQALVDTGVVFQMRSGVLNKHSHDHPNANSLFESMMVPLESTVNAQWLAEQLADQQMHLIRAKGFVRDKDIRIKTIQVVGRRASVTDAPADLPSSVQLGIVCIAKAGELDKARLRSICGDDAIA